MTSWLSQVSAIETRTTYGIRAGIVLDPAHAYRNRKRLEKIAGQRVTLPVLSDVLTDEQVVKIRQDYAAGRFTQHDLAVAYKVNASYIGLIVLGRRRASVGGPNSQTIAVRRLA